MLHKCDVKLYLCVKVNDVTLNMLHKCDVKLVIQLKVCDTDTVVI